MNAGFEALPGYLTLDRGSYMLKFKWIETRLHRRQLEKLIKSSNA